MDFFLGWLLPIVKYFFSFNISSATAVTFGFCSLVKRSFLVNEFITSLLLLETLKAPVVALVASLETL